MTHPNPDLARARELLQRAEVALGASVPTYSVEYAAAAGAIGTGYAILADIASRGPVAQRLTITVPAKCARCGNRPAAVDGFCDPCIDLFTEDSARPSAMNSIVTGGPLTGTVVQAGDVVGDVRP